MFSVSSSKSPSESEEKTRHKLRRFSASEERNKIKMIELGNGCIRGQALGLYFSKASKKKIHLFFKYQGPTLETKVCMSNFGTTTSSTGLDPEDIIIESLREGTRRATPKEHTKGDTKG
ncbi:hypothetical protein Tco_0647631 [Tanacetum coccineum]